MRKEIRLHKIVLASLFSVLIWCFIAGNILAHTLIIPANFQLVTETPYLQLYMDYNTTEIAVVDLRSNKAWFSNPENNQRTKGVLSIQYYTPSDDLRTMNSDADSVAYNQFEIKELDQGIRVDYTLGLAFNNNDYLPTFISADRFEELILNKLENESDRKFLQDRYTLISLEEVSPDFPRSSVSQVDKDALFGNYAMKIDKNLNARQRGDFIRHVLDQYRLERAGINSIREITPDLIESFIETPTMVIGQGIWPWDLETMIDIIKGTGYNPVDKQFDNEVYNIDPPEIPVEIFTVPIEYRLEQDSLTVRIPMEDVIYPNNVYSSQNWALRGVHWSVVEDELLMEAFGRITGGYVTLPLHTVSILPFFGAANLEQSGYMLIPDGSGALVNLTANRTRQTSNLNLQVPIYGRNLSIPRSVSDEQENQLFHKQAHLPVFGVNQENVGFLAVIEEGDALAAIMLETAGSVNPVDRVYPRFTLIATGAVELAESSRGGGGAAINTYQQRLPNSDVQVRYMFLNDQDALYPGMAQRYQQYLADNHSLNKVSAAENIPFYLELIGGIHKQQPIFGIPREVIEPLTTYEQAQTIVEEVSSRGFENIVLRYSGWLEGGLEHIYPSKVFLEKKLGNQSSFNNLVNYLNENEISFYPDITQTSLGKTRIGDGFGVKSHTASSLNNHYITGILPSGTISYILSMNKLNQQIDSFLTDYNKYNIAGLSLRDLGKNVYSDFQIKGESLDRQESREIIANAIDNLASEKSLLIDQGNVYALVHADHLVNVPMSSSGFTIADQEIPFYQMVVRGLINFTGEPINQGIDLEYAKLKLLEVGAYPYFTWGYQDSSIVKDTPFQYLLSTNYETWLDFALEFYSEVNEVLRDLQGQGIVDHQQLAGDVYQTTYEDGTRIIVNYGLDAIQIDELWIESKNYVVIEGEAK